MYTVHLTSTLTADVTFCQCCISSITMELHALITLCVYAQQGYVFGCVGLCMYVYILSTKNRPYCLKISC